MTGAIRALVLVVAVCAAQLALACKPLPPDRGSAIYEAIKSGNRAEALRLIPLRTGINDLSQSGRTPLFEAIWKRDEELAVALLKHGADPTAITRDRRSALNLAASVGSLRLVTLLHQSGIHADPKPGSAPSALFGALCNSSRVDDEHWRVVRYLIPLTDVAAEKWPELTSLYCAAGRAPVDIVAALLKKGATVAVANRPADPILFQTRKLDVMRLLVEHGADVRVTDIPKRSLLHWTGSRDIEIAKFLLSHGVDVNARDNQRRVPLFSAIESSSVDVAELFLAQGADRTAVDERGEGVVFYAAAPPKVHSMQFLLKQGIDVNVRNNRRETPVHAALKSARGDETERAAVIQLLLANGVDANAQDHNGITALNIASGKLDVSAMELLLTRGADPNKSDRLGFAPLHTVATKAVQPNRLPASSCDRRPTGPDQAFIDEQLARKHAAINMLLRHGAKADVRNGSQQRPVDLIDPKLEQRLGPLLEVALR